jgi:hypothetical protein
VADEPINLAAELIAVRATLQVLIAVLDRAGAPGLIEALREQTQNIISGNALVLPAAVATRDIYASDILAYSLQIIAETRAMAPLNAEPNQPN